MGQFQPNPAAEASVEFDCIQPGQYQMRVADVTDFVTKNGDDAIRVTLEHIDKSALIKENGEPAKNPGNVMDSGLLLTHAKQGKLKSLFVACGLDWDMAGDTGVLLGRELLVKLKVGEWQGVRRNETSFYVAPTTQMV